MLVIKRGHRSCVPRPSGRRTGGPHRARTAPASALPSVNGRHYENLATLSRMLDKPRQPYSICVQTTVLRYHCDCVDWFCSCHFFPFGTHPYYYYTTSTTARSSTPFTRVLVSSRVSSLFSSTLDTVHPRRHHHHHSLSTLPRPIDDDASSSSYDSSSSPSHDEAPPLDDTDEHLVPLGKKTSGPLPKSSVGSLLRRDDSCDFSIRDDDDSPLVWVVVGVVVVGGHSTTTTTTS